MKRAGVIRKRLGSRVVSQIRVKRNKLGLSQRDMSILLGVSEAYYSRLEREKVPASWRFMQAVERFLYKTGE